MNEWSDGPTPAQELGDELRRLQELLDAKALHCYVYNRERKVLLLEMSVGDTVPEADRITIAALGRDSALDRSAIADRLNNNRDAYAIGLVATRAPLGVGLVAIDPDHLPEDLLQADELGGIVPWAYAAAWPDGSIRDFELEAAAAPSPRAFVRSIVLRAEPDSAILWIVQQKQDSSGNTSQVMSAAATAGSHTSYGDFTVPIGRGIVGTLEPGKEQKIIDLRDRSSGIFNPQKVREEGWKFCIVAPIVAGGQLAGALTAYTRSDDPRVLENYVERFGIDTARAIPHVRRLRKNRGDIERVVKLEADLERLQVGIEVLGFAHDLAKSADEMNDRAAELAIALKGLSGRGIEPALAISAELGEKAQVVHRLTRAMNRLVQGQHDEITVFDVDQAVEDIDVILGAILPSLRVDIPRNLQVRGNPLDVQRIVINLVANATFWAPVDAPDVAVEGTTRTEDNKKYVELTVKDNGSGMSIEQTRRATNMLYSTRKNGLGLGLFVVKKLVEGLKGELRINSTELHGTTIKVLLPRVEGK